MKHLLLAWLIAPAALFCAEPLQVLTNAKWISDETRTQAWIAKHRPDLAQRGLLADAFGKMTCEFTTTTFTTHLDGRDDARQHKVLGQTTREIALQIFDPSQRRDVIVVLEVDADGRGYWVYQSEFDVKEHFVPAQ